MAITRSDLERLEQLRKLRGASAVSAWGEEGGDVAELRRWVIAVLHGGRPEPSTMLHNEWLALAYAPALWDSGVEEAVRTYAKSILQSAASAREPFATEYPSYGREEKQEVLRRVRTALERLLEAGTPRVDVEALFLHLWEGNRSFHGSAGTLDLNSEFVAFLLVRGLTLPLLALEAHRQGFANVLRAPAAEGVAKDFRIARFAGVADREAFTPLLELWEILDDLETRMRGQGLAVPGVMQRVAEFLERNRDLVMSAFPAVFSAYADNGSLLLTLATRLDGDDFRAELTNLAGRDIPWHVRDACVGLLAALAGGPLLLPADWGHRLYPEPVVVGSGRAAGTWIADPGAEALVTAAAARAVEEFGEWFQEQYATQEPGCTARLLTYLERHLRGAGEALRAWARNRGREFALEVTWIDHQPHRREKASGADFGLVLRVEAAAQLALTRGCLVQVKKTQVERETVRSGWVIEREQLELLSAFGDGGLYCLIAPSLPPLVIPARLVAGYIYGSGADKPTLSAQAASGARPLADFLVHDFIGGWIGEVSPEKLAAVTPGEGAGAGPAHLLDIRVRIGGEG